LVLKLFLRDGGRATTEFENLSMVAALSVPTPDPLYLDAEGTWFGVPALVMSALPGAPDMHPSDVDQWVSAAATALAAIHDLDPNDAGSVQIPRWQRWEPDTEGLGTDGPVIRSVLQQLYEMVGNYPTVFSHDDYNPGNVLFHMGQLSGVVDWTDVTIEPRQAAVALYRHLLAIHPGGAAPEQFLASYEAVTGRRLEDLALWDVLYGLRGVRKVDHWVSAFEGLGVQVTADEIFDRSLDWISQAVARVGT